MMRRCAAAGVASLTLTIALTSAAQTGAKPTEETGAKAAPVADDAASRAHLLEMVKAVSDRVDAREREIRALAASHKATAAELGALKDQVHAAAVEATAPLSERLLTFWGYMDAGFTKAWNDKPTGAYSIAYPNPSSFYSTGVNLFVKSELSSSFSVMVETQLTYTPSGVPNLFSTSLSALNSGSNVYVNGQYSPALSKPSIAASGNYFRDPVSYLGYRQNGIVIERAYFDWRVFDWLTLRAGRYLTPYGIWNEDHGSPVLLAAFCPYLVGLEFVPNQQMGAQMLGSRDLAEHLTVDYAATISNGRGPQDDYRDLEDNKALGLRLKMTYQAGDLLARLGAYGYVGSYANSTETAVVMLRSNLTLDPTAHPSLGIRYDMSQQYDEKALTLDGQLRYKGLRFYSELALHDVRYRKVSPIADGTQLLAGAPANTTVYPASHQGYAFFVLGGYEFDLGRRLASVRVTPYGGIETIQPDDTRHPYDLNAYRFGLNVKPVPYVTAKLEALRILPKSEALAANVWVSVAQVAVAF